MIDSAEFKEDPHKKDQHEFAGACIERMRGNLPENSAARYVGQYFLGHIGRRLGRFEPIPYAPTVGSARSIVRAETFVPPGEWQERIDVLRLNEAGIMPPPAGVNPEDMVGHQINYFYVAGEEGSRKLVKVILSSDDYGGDEPAFLFDATSLDGSPEQQQVLERIFSEGLDESIDGVSLEGAISGTAETVNVERFSNGKFHSEEDRRVEEILAGDIFPLPENPPYNPQGSSSSS